MKNQKIFGKCLFLLICELILGLALTSCTSLNLFKEKNASFLNENAIADGIVKIKEVNVEVDKISENSVSRQIFLLTKNLLFSEKANKFENGSCNSEINLKIDVNQKSFLKDSSIVNSIFFSFIFTDEKTGEEISVINEYCTGNESIYSIHTQEKYLKKALNQYFSWKSKKISKISKAN